jgi:hypothetical protein
MMLKGELATMMLEISPEMYRRYITADKKGKLVSEASKSPVWINEGKFAILQEAMLRTQGVWILGEPYQPLRGQLDNHLREEVDGHLARGQFDGIMQGWLWTESGKDTWQEAANAFGKKTQVSGNGYGVHGQRDGTGIDDHVPF